MTTNKFPFARRLLAWYDRDRRELPWRAPLGRLPDPYHVLVSETMLQQTQVATVIPYFLRFIGRLPTIENLASADEQFVLTLWQGLGYYSRARHLRQAAIRIVAEHGGRIPSDVDTLLQLPGIGRYTAGAIASIAYDQRAPILDGNVARVLCRLDAITGDPRQRSIQQHLWQRAAEILPANRCGDFNSALMELGSTVCTPRRPRCDSCPVRAACQAFASGVQQQIPAPRKAKHLPLLRRHIVCVCRGGRRRARWLIEQRPSRGRWAGLWQFVTVQATKSPVTAAAIGAVTGVRIDTPRQIGSVQHALTHRRYSYEVYVCRALGSIDLNGFDPPRRWVRLDQLTSYPLPRPHVKVAGMLQPLLERPR